MEVEEKDRATGWLLMWEAVMHASVAPRFDSNPDLQHFTCYNTSQAKQ